MLIVVDLLSQQMGSTCQRLSPYLIFNSSSLLSLSLYVSPIFPLSPHTPVAPPGTALLQLATLAACSTLPTSSPSTNNGVPPAAVEFVEESAVGVPP